jgi:tetratricopeptide (TPR) repeat protein
LEVASTVNDRIETLKTLGWVYNDTGDFTAAIENLSEALELAPDSSKEGELTFELGLTYLNMRDYVMALTTLQQAADMEPESRDVYIYIARAHEGLDDLAAALEAYKRYVELSEQQGESADEEVIQRIQQLERDLP